LSATLLSSDLFRKDFLFSAAAGAAVQHCREHDMNSLSIDDGAVETAALPKLRSANSDARSCAWRTPET
jgi:hypothetical protein